MTPVDFGELVNEFNATGNLPSTGSEYKEGTNLSESDEITILDEDTSSIPDYELQETASKEEGDSAVSEEPSKEEAQTEENKPETFEFVKAGGKKIKVDYSDKEAIKNIVTKYKPNFYADQEDNREEGEEIAPDSIEDEE